VKESVSSRGSGRDRDREIEARGAEICGQSRAQVITAQLSSAQIPSQIYSITHTKHR